MQRTVKLVVAAMVSLALGATWAAAEEKSKDKKEGSLPTEAFVKQVGYINLAEIEAGRLAMMQGACQGVRMFGEHLARDHQKANQEMLQLAAKNNWVLAGTTDEKHRALLQNLAGFKGAEFDREFVNAMVKGHKQAVQMFEAEARESKNAAVKSYAEKVLPTLRSHLKEAEKLQGELGKGKNEKK